MCVLYVYVFVYVVCIVCCMCMFYVCCMYMLCVNGVCMFVCVARVCCIFVCVVYVGSLDGISQTLRFCSRVFIHFSSCSTNWIMSVGLSQYIYL